MKKTKNHGGKREGAGRPKPPSPRKVRAVRLSEQHVAAAILIGGDVSEGIRLAIESHPLWTKSKASR